MSPFTYRPAAHILVPRRLQTIPDLYALTEFTQGLPTGWGRDAAPQQSRKCAGGRQGGLNAEGKSRPEPSPNRSVGRTRYVTRQMIFGDRTMKFATVLLIAPLVLASGAALAQATSSTTETTTSMPSASTTSST